MDFAVPAIKESEKKKKRDKYQDLARERKKTMKYEGDCDTNCGLCTWNGPKGLVKGQGGAKIRGQVETIHY